MDDSTMLCTGSIGAGFTKNKRLVVVSRGRNNEVFINTTKMRHETFDIWERMDGEITSDPVIGQNPNAQLLIFARGTDNALHYRWQTSEPDFIDTQARDWSAWQSLGGLVTSNIAIGTFKDEVFTKRLMVFVRGGENALHCKWQLSMNATDPDQWSEWTALGSPNDIEWLSDPAIAYDADGHLMVFMVGSDNAAWFKRLESATTGIRWSDWQSLGAPLDASRNIGVWTGIRLRLAMVSLETGELRYVTESGQFLGSPYEQLVNLPEAIIASSAIPSVFLPVKLNDQNYIDGAAAEMIPIKAAFDAGADEVYAIVAWPDRLENRKQVFGPMVGLFREPSFITSYEYANLVDIAVRSIVDIFVKVITKKGLEPPFGWPKPVHVIRPTMAIHDPLTINPGLVDISIAYGFMRASDDIVAQNPQEARRTSDEIIRIRKEIWEQEERFIRTLTSYRRSVREGTSPTGVRFYWFIENSIIGPLREIQDKKFELKTAVDARRSLSSGNDIPLGVENWWNNWERHNFNPDDIPSLWDNWPLEIRDSPPYIIPARSRPQ